MTLFENIENELKLSIDQSKELISREQSKINNCSLLLIDKAKVEQIAVEFSQKHGIKDSRPVIWATKTGIEISYRDIVDYDIAISYDNARLTNNGRWIDAVLISTIEKVTLRYGMEAKVPDDVKDTLVACKKIIIEESINTYSVC